MSDNRLPHDIDLTQLPPAVAERFLSCQKALDSCDREAATVRAEIEEARSRLNAIVADRTVFNARMLEISQTVRDWLAWQKEPGSAGDTDSEKPHGTSPQRSGPETGPGRKRRNIRAEVLAFLADRNGAGETFTLRAIFDRLIRVGPIRPSQIEDALAYHHAANRVEKIGDGWWIKRVPEPAGGDQPERSDALAGASSPAAQE